MNSRKWAVAAISALLVFTLAGAEAVAQDRMARAFRIAEQQ